MSWQYILIAIVLASCIFAENKTLIAGYIVLLIIAGFAYLHAQPEIDNCTLFGKKFKRKAKRVNAVVNQVLWVQGDKYRVTMSVKDNNNPVVVDVPISKVCSRFATTYNTCQSTSDYFIAAILEYDDGFGGKLYDIPSDWDVDLPVLADFPATEEDEPMRSFKNTPDEWAFILRTVSEVLIPLSVITMFFNSGAATIMLVIGIAGILCFIPSKKLPNSEIRGIIEKQGEMLLYNIKEFNISSKITSKSIPSVTIPTTKDEFDNIPIERRVEPEDQGKTEAASAIDGLLSKQRQEHVTEKNDNASVGKNEEKKELPIEKHSQDLENRQNKVIDSAESSESAPDLNSTEKLKYNNTETEPDSNVAVQNITEELILNSSASEVPSKLKESKNSKDEVSEENGIDKKQSVSVNTEPDAAESAEKPSTAKKTRKRKTTGKRTKKAKSQQPTGQMSFDFITEEKSNESGVNDGDESNDTISVAEEDTVVVEPKKEHINKYGDSLIKKKQDNVAYEIKEAREDE